MDIIPVRLFPRPINGSGLDERFRNTIERYQKKEIDAPKRLWQPNCRTNLRRVDRERERGAPRISHYYPIIQFCSQTAVTPCKHKQHSTCVFFSAILLSNRYRHRRRETMFIESSSDTRDRHFHFLSECVFHEKNVESFVNTSCSNRSCIVTCTRRSTFFANER